ncbi:hypothetical protein [Enterobacter hormaechei]|uniref:hypothetical protein n=1 Tax=Enterobacter hormaechei TaxID=158836 RepID=UPI001FD48238|nr:hypothetical protein [Enterobacter hormaechei]
MALELTVKAQQRALRDEFIVSTDRMLVSDYTINNVLLTSEQQAELLDVRQKFKVWPESEGWPGIALPAIPQWILIEAVNNGYVVKNWEKSRVYFKPIQQSVIYTIETT